MKAERKEELLQLADGLTGRLRKVPVPALREASSPEAGVQVAGVGIPAACIGQLTSFLAAHSDVTELQTFLGLLDQLDPIAAQNQRNPKAHYAVLKTETQRFLQANPELTGEEYLYVLEWVRRLLPSAGSATEDRARGETAARPPRPTGQLAQELKSPHQETWRTALVSYDAGGGGVVRASLAGKTAEARQAGARLLIETLSPKARERMVEQKKRKPIKAEVDVERLGRSWRLVAVRESK